MWRKASKKKKKEDKDKRNKKSSEGCHIKRRKAKKKKKEMFPWMIMPGIESGRSRRRRESSSDSRRRRRDIRRRDRTRSRERSRGRSPRSRRSEGSSSLPVAEPGYRWCQIPETVLQGGTGQSWSQRGSGSSSKWKQSWGQQREKGWNKWPKKDEGRAWAKQDPKDKPPEGGEVSAAAPDAPEEDPYQVAVATQEEIDAAAARQAEREEEGFHAQLWQDAIQQALADPDRPLCVRELVKNGRLTAWWSMSWKDARAQIDGALVDEYRGLLRGYFVGPPEGPGKLPEPVLERCACIFAWFKQNNRPVFQVEGRAIEGSIFKVPGQMVVLFPTNIHGPSYKEPANHRHSMTISHGLPWTSVLGVGQLGELAPGDFIEGEFPSYGFSGRGSCNEFSQGSIRASVTKVAARAKGKDVILTMEGQLEVNTPQVEGGMYHMNAACRDAGSARSSDHLLLHPRNAVLKGIAVPWPV